jgi:multiple sugar transport system ATP-binding protein
MANVSLIDVEKRFGSHVVIPSLNLEIADGSFVVLVGPRPSPPVSCSSAAAT